MNDRNQKGNKLAVAMIIVIVVGVLGFAVYVIAMTMFGPRM